MQKGFPLLVSLFFLAAALAACSPQAQEDALPIVTVAAPTLPGTLTYADDCTVLEGIPTPPPDASYVPPVSRADFVFGPADAPVTVIEYCDFQADSCRTMADTIAKLMKNRSNARFVFRPYPLIGRLDKSDKAVVAALAADAQGKFWTMYDFLFVSYPLWDKLRPEEFYDWVIKESPRAGIDAAQLKAAIEDPKTTTRMTALYQAAQELKFPSVPIVVVNGSIQQAYLLNYPNLSEMIDMLALGQKQFGECPPFDVNPLKQYIATIHTEKGDIVIQLFPDKAPLAVNSFLFLARQKWFDGVTFHRVIPGYLAQAGDPTGTGKGNPGYFFKNETSDLRFNMPGMVGMANAGPDSNGSQFFITFAPQPDLDGSYTIFGQVIRGLDVAEKLTPRNPAPGEILPPGDLILSVEIDEK